MTRATSSTWMPRAAMSVATRVAALPEWNASMLRVRAFWLRLPCSSTVGTPLRLSWRVSALAPCLVRVKTTVRPGRAGQVDQDGDPVLAADVQDVVVHRRDRRLRRVGLVGDRRVEEPLDQDVDRLVQRGREEQPLAVLGVWSSRRRTAGRKPRSAMWSASSRTVTSTAPRSSGPGRSGPRAGRGRRATMSTPRRRPWTCGFWPTPPKTVWVVRPAASASGLSASWIWPTSSRVGARISARGCARQPGGRDAARRATSGSRNA